MRGFINKSIITISLSIFCLIHNWFFIVVESYVNVYTTNSFHARRNVSSFSAGTIRTTKSVTIILKASSSLDVENKVSGGSSYQDVANKLKIKLLSQSNSNSNSNSNSDSNSNSNSDNNNEEDEIEFFVQRLIQEEVKFDPNICLNGPLYTVLYQSGPVPFWEKYDFKFLPFRNLKGQQYTSIASAIDESETNNALLSKNDGDANMLSFDLINYAQFWSTNLSIQGCGVCTFLQQNNSNNNNQEEKEKKKKINDIKINNNFFTSLLFPKESSEQSQQQQQQRQLLKCPVDYKVEIQNASISFLGRKFQLGVNGIGYTRILYADEEMRILLAPKDTTDERWLEKAGLVVVQVRSDLVVGKELKIIA